MACLTQFLFQGYVSSECKKRVSSNVPLQQGIHCDSQSTTYQWKGGLRAAKSNLFYLRGPGGNIIYIYIYNDPLDKCKQKCQLKMFCCSAGCSNTCQSKEDWKKLSSTGPVHATQTEGNANNPELHKSCSKLVLSQSVPSTTFGWLIESGPMCVCLLV